MRRTDAAESGEAVPRRAPQPDRFARRRTSAPAYCPCRSTWLDGARACASGGLLRLSARLAACAAPR